MELEKIITIIENVNLFKGMEKDRVKVIIEKTAYQVKSYEKGTFLAHEGDRCERVGIVLEGQIELRKEFPAGHYMTLTYLDVSSVFGEVIIFAKMSPYPATLIALSKCEILYLSREDLMMLIEDCEDILRNFMSVLSNKIIMLNKRIAILSFKTIEEKVASYLLEAYKRSDQSTFNIPLKRNELAGYLNIPRPSLSRTMGKMKKEGLIDFYQNTIKIQDMEGLENYLLK